MLAVVDLDPQSSSYGTKVDQPTIPDELHHLG
jgi:hypothetical protein